MKSRPGKGRSVKPKIPGAPALPPILHTAEEEMRAVIEKIGERIIHHCDRPEIETQILNFLVHAAGPSTEGIAAQMGLSVEATAVHLQSLSAAKRIWSQPAHGTETAWHIAQEGRHFLTERGTAAGE